MRSITCDGKTHTSVLAKTILQGGGYIVEQHAGMK